MAVRSSINCLISVGFCLPICGPELRMSTMMVYMKEFDIGPLIRQSSRLVNVVLIHIRDDGNVQCFLTSFMSLRERPKRMFEALKPRTFTFG